jgi:hypothetical protein
LRPSTRRSASASGQPARPRVADARGPPSTLARCSNRALVDTLDVVERDREGRIVIVDLKPRHAHTRTSRSKRRFNSRSTATRPP